MLAIGKWPALKNSRSQSEWHIVIVVLDHGDIVQYVGQLGEDGGVRRCVWSSRVFPMFRLMAKRCSALIMQNNAKH